MLIDNAIFFNLYYLIYFCTACLVMVSALSSEIKKDTLIQNSLGKYLVFFPLISLMFLTGFREYNVGTDTYNYYQALWVRQPELNFNSEFLFDLIALGLRFFELNYTYFLFLIAFIFYIFIYKALKNYTDLYKSNLFITFFSCISFFFFLSSSINIIRQGVSLSILLFAYSLWVGEKNKIHILLLIFLSLSFHLTSILPIIIFVVSSLIKFKTKNHILLIAYFISIILSYMNYGFLDISPLFLEILGEDKRSGYFLDRDTNYDVGFKSQFVIFNTFFLIIFFYIRSRIMKADLKFKYSNLISYYILSSILMFLAFQLPFSDRWGLFSWYIIPFLISPAFYSPFVKGNIKIHFVIMLVLIYLGFNFYA